MIAPHRRHFLQGICSCSLLGLAACNATTANDPPLVAGYRPDASTDEGGLWYAVDKAEQDVKRARNRVHDAEWNGYLNDIIQRLNPDLHPNMRVYLLRVPIFNASMAPNGMMQVYTGLLLRAKNEAQLASVLGHEIAHYTQRHSIAGARDARARSDFAVFLSMGLAAAGFGAVNDMAQYMLIAGKFAYNRDQEREADRVGLDMMRRAGYQPLAASEIWQQMIEEDEADGSRRKGNLVFASHPQDEERMKTLRDMAREKGDTGDYHAERYREKIRRVRFMLLEDDLRLRRYQESLLLLRRLQSDSPNDAELLFFEAEVYRLRRDDGDAKKSEQTYERAIQAGKAPAQTWRSLGLLLHRDGRKGEAAKHFRTYLELRPDADDRRIIMTYIGEVA